MGQTPRYKGLLQEANQRRVKNWQSLESNPVPTTELRPPSNHQALIIRCPVRFLSTASFLLTCLLISSTCLLPVELRYSQVLTTEPLRYGVRDAPTHTHTTLHLQVMCVCIVERFRSNCLWHATKWATKRDKQNKINKRNSHPKPCSH